MQKNKKLNGFTLTELAIVIAVIAVLIAVLVPTFISLINKSNNSADEQTVTNMNTALSVDEADSDTPEYLCEVWDILEDYGFSSPFKPSLTANTFFWYKTDNRILIYNNDDKEFTFPAEYTGMTIDNTASAGGAVTANTKVAAAAITQISSDDLMNLAIDSSNVKAHESSFTKNGTCTLCQTYNSDLLGVKEVEVKINNVTTACVALTDVSDDIETLIIPEGVTLLGSGTSSGTNIFGDDVNSTTEHSILKEVVIPDSVTYIGYAAFRNCTELTVIDIPDSVTTIYYAAFENCIKLKELNIGSGLTSFGSSTGIFHGCYRLATITVSSDNENFKAEDNVLYSKDGTTLYLYAAAKTDTEFTTPESVTTIAHSAFYGIKSTDSSKYSDITIALETLNLTSVETLSQACLYYSSVTTLNIMSSNVTTMVKINSNAFISTEKLNKIIISGSNVTIGSSSSYGLCTNNKTVKTLEITGNNVTLYNSSTSSKGVCANSVIENLVITGTGITIGKYSFYGCTKLSSIDLSNVTSVGQYAFSGCTSLATVTLPASITINANAFNGCSGITTVNYGGTSDQWTTLTSSLTTGNTALTAEGVTVNTSNDSD